MKRNFVILLLFLFFKLPVFPQSVVSCDETMQRLISLFKSYIKAEKGETLKPEDILKNKETALKFEEIFHYKTMIEGALADQWPQMSKKQQDEFFSKFKSLVELVAYPQGSYFYKNSKNSFKKAVMRGTAAVVESQNYNYDKDREVSINYIFKSINGSWVLVDAEMNEHSLVEEYRMMINRIVAKNGLAGLMDVMNKKYEELTK